MLDIFMKIVFFIFILPYLIVENAVEKINAHREKQGKEKLKVDVLHVLLGALIILLIVVGIHSLR